MEKKLLIATGSKTKVAAWQNLFETVPLISRITIVPPEHNINGRNISAIDVEERADDAATYFDNALLKAKAYWEKYRIPVLADDSGVEVDVLGGYPGIITSRCSGKLETIATHIIERVDAAAGDNWSKREAHYCTCAVFIDADGHILYCNTKRSGWIAKEAKGEGNQVETMFIPSCVNPTKQPYTLGQLPRERRCGQHFQTAIAYPVEAEREAGLPMASFLQTIDACIDNNDEFSSHPTLDYIKRIMDGVPTGVPFKYENPINPETRAEAMFMYLN